MCTSAHRSCGQVPQPRSLHSIPSIPHFPVLLCSLATATSSPNAFRSGKQSSPPKTPHFPPHLLNPHSIAPEWVPPGTTARSLNLPQDQELPALALGLKWPFPPCLPIHQPYGSALSVFPSRPVFTGVAGDSAPPPSALPHNAHVCPVFSTVSVCAGSSVCCFHHPRTRP